MALFAVACAKPVQPIVAVAPADLARIGVAEVRYVYQAQKPLDAAFTAGLERQVNHALQACATGDLKRNFEILIEFYRRADPALTVLLADANQLHGKLRLIDPATNAPAGEYAIKYTLAGSGLLGVGIMAYGDEKMQRGFAVHLCKDLLGKPVPPALPDPAKPKTS